MAVDKEVQEAVIEKGCGYRVPVKWKWCKVCICCKPSYYIMCLSCGKSALRNPEESFVLFFVFLGFFKITMMVWSHAYMHARDRKFRRKVDFFQERLICHGSPLQSMLLLKK